MNTVRDCMSPHLVYLRAGDRPEIVRQPMLDRGLTAVAVLDDEHRPVGLVTLADLAAASNPRPAHTVRADTPVSDAGRRMAELDVHHLVVVDAQGAAVGMLSSLDVVRAVCTR